MASQIDRDVKKDSTEDAKVLRQCLVAAFDQQVSEQIPAVKKGSGRFWTVPLNKDVYFYVTFEFPKWLTGDSTFAIFHGVEASYAKPTENMSVRHERYVKYPYRIHHQLFEFSNVAWNKNHVGYPYWLLLMQNKKLHYYTEEQVDYVINRLFPFAIQEIGDEYNRLRRKFENTNKKLPDLRVGQ